MPEFRGFQLREKTGTAQVVDHQNGVRQIHAFPVLRGFSSIKPKFVIYVVNEPEIGCGQTMKLRRQF